MEWTTTYILSQVFTIMMYALLAITYYMKDRKKILIVSFLSVAANGVAYIFLSAWSGLAMCFLAIIRNIIFIADEKKNGKREAINKTDIFILIVLYVIAVISAVYTYDGWGSILSVIATMLYTYSVWQKNTRIYKFFGIPVGILWIFYNIYIMSLFGIILESILLVCSTIGYIFAVRTEKQV